MHSCYCPIIANKLYYYQNKYYSMESNTYNNKIIQMQIQTTNNKDGCKSKNDNDGNIN